jgi:hypothetical protein
VDEFPPIDWQQMYELADHRPPIDWAALYQAAT